MGFLLYIWLNDLRLEQDNLITASWRQSLFQGYQYVPTIPQGQLRKHLSDIGQNLVRDCARNLHLRTFAHRHGSLCIGSVKFSRSPVAEGKCSKATQKQFPSSWWLLIFLREESSCRWLLQSNVTMWALPGTKFAITGKRLYVLLPFHLYSSDSGYRWNLLNPCG